MTGFLGGRGGSQCRVTPTPNHCGRFALWLAGRSDRPPLSFRQGGATVGSRGGPLRSGRWHIFRQRRLGQRSSALGSLRHHLFFNAGAGVGTRAALHHHSLNIIQNTGAQAYNRLARKQARILALALGHGGNGETRKVYQAPTTEKRPGANTTVKRTRSVQQIRIQFVFKQVKIYHKAFHNTTSSRAKAVSEQHAVTKYSTW